MTTTMVHRYMPPKIFMMTAGELLVVDGAHAPHPHRLAP